MADTTGASTTADPVIEKKETEPTTSSATTDGSTKKEESAVRLVVPFVAMLRKTKLELWLGGGWRGRGGVS